MKVRIHTENIEFDATLRQYAEEKVLRLDRHFDQIHEARLDIEAEALRRAEPVKVATLQVHVNGSVLKARVEATEVAEAVDLVTDKLDEQLRRRKERITDHKGTHLGRTTGRE